MNEANNLVSRKRLEWIAYNYELSLHAKDRIKERSDTIKTMRELILNSPLAWGLGNNKYCIALNLYEYIVVEHVQDFTHSKPTIITFVNMKESDYNVIDKFVYAYDKLKNKYLGEEND